MKINTAIITTHIFLIHNNKQSNLNGNKNMRIIVFMCMPCRILSISLSLIVISVKYEMRQWDDQREREECYVCKLS